MEEHAQRHFSDLDLIKSFDVSGRIFESVSKFSLKLFVKVLFGQKHFSLCLICVYNISRERCKELIELAFKKIIS